VALDDAPRAAQTDARAVDAAFDVAAALERVADALHIVGWDADGLVVDDHHRLVGALEAVQAEEFVAPDGRTSRVTFSAGVAEYPLDGTDLHSLFKVADAALYRAKARRPLERSRCLTR